MVSIEFGTDNLAKGRRSSSLRTKSLLIIDTEVKNSFLGDGKFIKDSDASIYIDYILQVNGTRLSNVRGDALIQTPSTPFPFKRFTTFANESSMHLYHQLDENVFAEEILGEFTQTWNASNSISLFSG